MLLHNYGLTYWLTYLLTYSPTGLLTYAPTGLLNYAPTHLSRRKVRQRQRVVIRALITVRRFLRHIVRDRRHLQQLWACTHINRLIRGYIVRCRLPQLIDTAIMRRAVKGFTVIRIRNWLRNCARRYVGSEYVGSEYVGRIIAPEGT